MRFIDNIEIKNFKSIRQINIKDCRRVNLFIGYPNVGKSNILEALSLFSFDRPSMNFSSLIRSEKLTTFFFDGNVGEQIEVKINGSNKISAKLEADGIKFNWSLSVPDEKVGNLTFPRTFQILNFSKSENQDKLSLWDLRFSNRENHPDYSKEVEKRYLAPIKKYSFNKNVQFFPGKYDSLSFPSGENIFDILITHSEIKREIEELFKGYKLELVYDSREQRFIIQKRTSSGVFSVPYELVADTLQRLIFYKTAILSNKETILIFEEPEAHMYPPYITKITSDIIFNKNNNQYFIATHSPFVLNDFMDEVNKEDISIYLVGLKDGGTVIKRLTEAEITEVHQFGIDLFFNLEDYFKDAVS